MHRARRTRHAAARCLLALASIASIGVLATTGTAGAGTSKVLVDHFLCYAASSSLRAPSGVRVVDALQRTGYAPQISSTAAHCNPADLHVPHAIDKVHHPDAHQLCWTTVDSFEPLTISIENQFGTADMTSGSPSLLCLPTWMALSGFPKQKTAEPTGLDNFACYPLTEITGAYDLHLPKLSTLDEFSSPRYVNVTAGTADQLCVPAELVVNGRVEATQGPNDPSLVCFGTTPTTLRKHVDDEDQFGHAVVTLSTHAEQLCVPSTITPITTRG
jgi:hypothetical protein